MPGEPLDLAIHGGPPAVTVGPFEWPPADGAIRDAIADAVESGEWGRYHGAPCARLVERLAREFAASHVQLTCSGTIAVEVALHAVGVGPGDEVILAGYDFPGNFRAIESLGARPVLVDVAAQDWVIDLDKLEQNTADLRAARAVVVSHLHGRLLDMPRLMALAVEHGWAVVEDACQCPGAEIAG
ncbi:MAG: aminotransferase class V-fold PLP-dependent enzyme, partial [Planctomycetota bacterium]